MVKSPFKPKVNPLFKLESEAKETDEEEKNGEFYNHWIEDGMHKLHDISEKSKLKLKAYIGHIKKTSSYIAFDNEFIQYGYRINFNTKKRICKSLFMLHNETINVWSHLIGVGCFIGLMIYTLIYLSPLTSYFTNSSEIPDRESIVNQASLVMYPHSDLNTLNNFQEITSKFFRTNISTDYILPLTEAQYLWSQTWNYELYT